MNINNLKTDIISPEVAEFLIGLHEKFDNLRKHLLFKRRSVAQHFEQGGLPTFLESTRSIREGQWSVAPTPADLRDRRVEITGPAEPKMIINALNSSARVFMADFEDSLSPTWENILLGQSSLMQAVRGSLSIVRDEKIYSLNKKRATLVVRPRGLHLEEKNFQIRGQSISASLFDFGVYLFHNAQELIERKSGPYFYLPKIESHEEAQWWNEVFTYSQKQLNIPHGSIRATVLIETITAAFEMDEILYALKDHASGLNAGRWDYIFSFIKKFHLRKDCITPDRALITMATPLMASYCRLLVQTCHRRQAHAIGGMAAFIPNRKAPEVTRLALERVQQDKRREALLGFDGTWVAHPDLIEVAEAEFTSVLHADPDQKDKQPEGTVAATDLLQLPPSLHQISIEGVRTNINVSLLYFDRWFDGVGAAAIHNLMEDAATAEISRSQLWQWLHHGISLTDGRTFTPELFHSLLNKEVHKLIPLNLPYLDRAVSLLSSLVLAHKFEDFFTIKAYEVLNTLQLKGDTYESEHRATTATAGI